MKHPTNAIDVCFRKPDTDDPSKGNDKVRVVPVVFTAAAVVVVVVDADREEHDGMVVFVNTTSPRTIILWNGVPTNNHSAATMGNCNMTRQ